MTSELDAAGLRLERFFTDPDTLFGLSSPRFGRVLRRMRLEGIGAIVSGGASGLGEATARALVERGAKVAIVDVQDDKAKALAEELGDATIAVHGDVTKEDEVEAAVAAAVEAFGGIRVRGRLRRRRLGGARRQQGRARPAAAVRDRRSG